MSRQPDYLAYGIKESEQKSFWTRLGAAWKNRDESINVVLDYLPLDGKVQLRKPPDAEPQP